MDLTVFDDLKMLCSGYGCANQSSITAVAIELLKPLVDDVYTDAMGNVIGMRHATDPTAKTVLLEAHMDEIGFLVTHIDDAGFLHVAAVGGVDARVIAAQAVMVFGDKPYHGVFCSVPPHLSGNDKPLPTVEEMGIDIGMTADEARACVPLGSRVTFVPHFTMLNDCLVCSKSLDNRSGMAAVIACLRQLTTRDVNVAVAFCVQEEVGCRGASVVAQQIKPDLALVTDVSFAMACGENSTQCGTLGSGVMIGVSPVLHEPIVHCLFTLANTYNISYQIEVMAATTGTDADKISITGCGVPTALLSIPLRYMHTPNEVVDVRDISAVAALMARFIEGGICL